MGRGLDQDSSPVKRKAKKSKFEQIKKDKLRLLYLTSDEDVEKAVELIERMKPESIALDFETASKNKRWGALNGSIRLIQIGIEKPGESPLQIVLDCYQANPEPLKKILQNKEIEKQIHYSKFEQEWAWVHLGVKINNIYDTCLAWREIQRALKTLDQEEREKIIPGWEYHDNKLSTILSRYLDLEMPKENQASDWGSPELIDEQMIYATMDVVCLPELVEVTKDYAKKVGCQEEVDRAVQREQQKTLRGTRASIESNGDDLDRVVRALERSRDLDELERVWETRKQVTVLPKSEKELQKVYRAARKRISEQEG